MVVSDPCPLGPLGPFGIVGSLITKVIDAVTTDNSIEEGEKAQQLPNKAIKQVKNKLTNYVNSKSLMMLLHSLNNKKIRFPMLIVSFC